MESTLKLTISSFLFFVIFTIYTNHSTERRLPVIVSLNRHSGTGNFSRNSSSVLTSTLDNSCIGMFDIGFNLLHLKENINFSDIYGKEINSKDWNQLLKEKEAASQSRETYFPFVKSIVKRITKLANGSISLQNGTRLQMMNGKLPYIPCKIKDYDKNDLHRCLSKWQDKNKTLWIIFMGDSRMRNMFFFFVKRTMDLKKWRIDMIKYRNLILEKISKYHDHSSGINATSVNGDLISYEPADFGMTNNEFSIDPKRPRELLHHLLKLNWKKDKFPDLLVINFGLHEYALPTGKSILESHSEIISNWKEMNKILKHLSRMMNVISLYQTLPRDSSLKIFQRSRKPKKDIKDYYFRHLLMDYGRSYIDNVMWEVNRKSNLIKWDSTFPFNIASSEECNDLMKQNYFLINEESKKGLPFQALMCHDPVHKSGPTVHDEITMLWNLLCNKIMLHEPFHCCT